MTKDRHQKVRSRLHGKSVNSSNTRTRQIREWVRSRLSLSLTQTLIRHILCPILQC
ncbi:MAG: hypothetical protein RH949_32380 [Coleofasciculus sp. A1-SPW-01]|uniref:hypothetical protein n=1 Tax=Coleofasciculus sp. A1-SPW-01 TaxID=3070819 RepID=UPI0032F6B675